MKYLLVIGDMTFGGAQRVMSNLANQLSCKHEIILVSIWKSNLAFNLSSQINFINGIGCSSLYSAIFYLRSIIKKEHPSIILSFLSTYNILTLLASFNLKIPIVVSERNDPKVEPRHIILKMLRKVLYPFADGFVFQTAEAQNYFSKKIVKKSVVIPNPIFINKELNNLTITKKKIIFSAGRLENQKNFKLLISAFSKIINKFPSYQLHIYGQGRLKSELQVQIDQLGLQDKVKLLGVTDDLHKFLKESELFVLSSNHEGMPNILMEAMALGVCCISTDCPCGGPRFLIKNDVNGFLFPIGDEDKLISLMDKILTDKDVRKRVSMEALKIYEDLNPILIVEQWDKYLYKTANMNTVQNKKG
ncbi:MAG: glycosyltransferase family 4 protein [Pleomorphochaeta sp.]